MPKEIMTLDRFIIEQEHKYPEATGEFTALLYNITLAAKIISGEVRKAGLVDILGSLGRVNVSGDEVKKLDVYANKVLKESLLYSGHICVMATEEDEDIFPTPKPYKSGKYVVLFDPLDGSSNIDVNVSIGTIFSIYRRISSEGPGTLEDCLQVGTKQVCSGYVLYGSSTMLIYTTGAGVHGFTLDPAIGEFLLSHPNMTIPPRGKYFSINMGNQNFWDAPTQRYIQTLTSIDKEKNFPYSLRYIGSLVADFHRTLLYGGIFLYPLDYKNPEKPKGKLRLLYEANPLAFVVEQAGGKATTGRERILEVQPQALHQRVPLIIGSPYEVDLYDQMMQEG